MQPLRIIRYKASTTSLRKPLIWLRNLGLDSNDVFLASYPRSGNFWLRFLIAEIVTGNVAEFDNLQNIIPEIGVHHGALPLLPSGGRVIKTHELYHEAYRRAIYIVRDPRDILLSIYAGEKEGGLVYAHDFDEYTRAYLGGQITRWGSWRTHVESWMNSPLARSGDMLVTRYEDMKQNVEAVLTEALKFLGLSADAGAIRRALADNSVDNLRKREESSQKLTKWRSGDVSPLLRKSEARRFIRTGVAGGWRNQLTPAQNDLFKKELGDLIEFFGYEC